MKESVYIWDNILKGLNNVSIHPSPQLIKWWWECLSNGIQRKSLIIQWNSIDLAFIKVEKYSFIPNFFVKSTYCLSFSQLTKHGEYFEISLFWIVGIVPSPIFGNLVVQSFLIKEEKIICLCLVLVVALGIFDCVHVESLVVAWDLVPWSRIPLYWGAVWVTGPLKKCLNPSYLLSRSPLPNSSLSLNPTFSLSLPKFYKSVVFL